MVRQVYNHFERQKVRCVDHQCLHESALYCERETRRDMHKGNEKYIQLFDEDKSGNYVASHRRPIYDSNGAFLIAELGNIDTQLHLPLEKVTFGEDVSPRLGVQVTDEVQEWTNTFGSVNGTGGITGKPWVNQGAQDAANVDSTTVMFKQNVYNIKLAVSWTELELMKAQRLQRPIDVDRITILEKRCKARGSLRKSIVAVFLNSSIK